MGYTVTVAVLFPTVGNAQVFQLRTPPPDISAAAAPWQVNSEPIMVGGLTYHPTRGFRLFDGQVMAPTGIYEGVPVYADTTIEPHSELYVPADSEPAAVGTGGRLAPGTAVVRKGARPRRVTIGSAPKSATVSGVWLEYDGARWYSNGAAASFSADRFEPVGEYHGFPVYRDKLAGTSDIWVSLVKDGPLAPYARR